MSHRLPPEDKDTTLRFFTLLLVFLGVLFGVWYGLLEVLA